ncbi:hypothetical protein PVL29_026110 [Vitis rotundifolia]|uniref:Uncharacterized protein n=1 Tax=Vitis rotundifolia TaxID=103349 RepID=A0AA39D859_VITRO|nr:hypothetical protein PVL29_026110 [Vitis rotundifolia]
MSMYWQGCNKTPITSLSVSLTNALESIAPAPSFTESDHTPSLIPSSSMPSLTPLNSTLPKIFIFSYSGTATLPSYSAPVNLNIINMPSFPSSYQDVNTIEAPITGKIVSDLVLVPPIHSLHHSTSAIGGSTSGLLLTLPPILLTPDQLKVYLGQMDKVAPTSTSLNTLSTMSTLNISSTIKSTVQFTEEFSFIAVNEGFKKDKVWGIYSWHQEWYIEQAGLSQSIKGKHRFTDRTFLIGNLIPEPRLGFFKDTLF